MISEAVARCLHEAGHAIAARVQNLGVVHAVAAENSCEVLTRWRRPTTTAAAIDTLEVLAITDLAGPAAEQFYLDEKRRDAEWGADERNASSRARAIVRLRNGMAEDAEPKGTAVDAVLEDLRARADELVRSSPGAISRVAAALAAGPLAQDQIDALIADEAGLSR